MKKKTKIKSREEERTSIVRTFYLKCPIKDCPKEIKGTSESQVKYNLDRHLDKHKKEENENTHNKLLQRQTK